MKAVKARPYTLDINQATAIYRLKFLASTSSSAPDAQVSSSALVAAQYGVSSKTVRDIWNRKTWIYATAQPIVQEHASSDDPAHIDITSLQLRPSKVGRPKGSRDKMPRARKPNKAQSGRLCCTESQDRTFRELCNSGLLISAVASAANNGEVTALPATEERPRESVMLSPFQPAQCIISSQPYQSSPTAVLYHDCLPRTCDPCQLDASCPPAPDAAADAGSALGFADPFHHDWPHW